MKCLVVSIEHVYIPKMLKSVIRQYWFTGAATISTIVVVASAAYYVAFSEPETFTAEKKHKGKARNKISGLVNEGNTCYINTTLQALASCPIFIRWINSLIGRQADINSSLRTTTSLHMTMAGKL